MVSGLKVAETKEDSISITWDALKGAQYYYIYWADKNLPTTKFLCIGKTSVNNFTLHKSAHVPHYFRVSAFKSGKETALSGAVYSPVLKKISEQREKLSRGLVAVKRTDGIFLAWRLFIEEVQGYSSSGLTGVGFYIYKNGKKIAEVHDSTNFLDTDGTSDDWYSVSPVHSNTDGVVPMESTPVQAWKSGTNYIDIPMKIPEGGITPAGQTYTYSINDMSVGDADGDGEYEYYVKWDPSNSHDVSHKGYTGNCFIDCYKLDGRLLWRIDMGKNIRSGAHYTQFMVYDFDGDGKAEMAVKTAPGTKTLYYNDDGSIRKETYITIPAKDIKRGITHSDNYVCSAEDYRNHLVSVFRNWHSHPEVKAGHWPETLEECFGLEKSYTYPLSKTDADALVTYFYDVYAKQRSPKNDLSNFEGFIFTGPEYLTMFDGNGEEIETIDFPFPRIDDGLMWGDYAWNRIEPCNRVDRFLSGVAYLDGMRPYLIVCRGYYTRAAVASYSFFDRTFKQKFCTDSGFVPMKNPFKGSGERLEGISPLYGSLAGQGNHSLAAADIDGDGCQEIIFGAAAIDHDGSILYSSRGNLNEGKDLNTLIIPSDHDDENKPLIKFGHGDAMHTARIDPDLPGFQTFNVFEEGSSVPWGYALRDAATGRVLFGKPSDKDLGRCMIGDIDPSRRGLEVWVDEVLSCTGKSTGLPLPGTNQSIRWSADMTTQIIDGNDIFANHSGVIHDSVKGAVLIPEGTAVNNGTKGNPCLVADLFGDWREELVLRTSDNSAVRIYMNTNITCHKLFTLMHDIQYRAGVAWQNNCYNQPCYTKFYFAHDTDWKYVLPELAEKE